MPVTLLTKEDYDNLQAQIDHLDTRVIALEEGGAPSPSPSPSPPPSGELDKIGKRVGAMLIGKKDYDTAAKQQAIAKFSIAVLGIYQGWKGDVGGDKMRDLCVSKIKALNPTIRLGNYTCLNECRPDTDIKVSASADVAQKLFEADWWLRNAAGEMVRYTDTYSAYDTNFTSSSTRDEDGLRFPAWYAARCQRVLFGVAGWDFAYSDNAMKKYRGPDADWMCNGVDVPNDDPDVIDMWRNGQRLYWMSLHLATHLPVMGNPDNDLSYPQYTQRLDGAFFEGAMGKSYSMTNWNDVWARYAGLMHNCRDPRTVLFNVSASLTNTRLFLFGLCTALLGDGVFVLTDADESEDYSNADLWFDEYELRLGKPTEPIPTGPQADETWMRFYQGGAVLVNASPDAAYTTSAFSGHFHYPDGSPVGTITMDPSTGLIILRN